jgi:hypothetical protein
MRIWSGEVLARVTVTHHLFTCTQNGLFDLLVPLGGQLFVVAVIAAVIFVLDDLMHQVKSHRLIGNSLDQGVITVQSSDRSTQTRTQPCQ